jgi:hypothetical protein
MLYLSIKLLFILTLAVIMTFSARLIKTMKIEYFNAPTQIKSVYVYRILVITILNGILFLMSFHTILLIDIFNTLRGL